MSTTLPKEVVEIIENNYERLFYGMPCDVAIEFRAACTEMMRLILEAQGASQKEASPVEPKEGEDDLFENVKTALNDAWTAAQPRTASARELAWAVVGIYEKEIAKAREEKKDEAVRMLKWIADNDYESYNPDGEDDEEIWATPGGDKFISAEELYTLFTNQNPSK